MVRLLILVFLLPSVAAAEEWPALHAVTGVAADDVLNVRNAPSAGGEIIGTLDPFQTGVEVMRTDDTGRWGVIISGEQAGWVAMRFLEAMPGGFLPEYGSLSCGGTEPFWRLEVTEGATAEFAGPEQSWGVSAGSWIPASGMRWPYAMKGEGDGRTMTAVITPEICSDGMSDREYGLSVTLVSQDSSETQVYSGCCTLGVGQ
ncbi:COG3650 family protein [Primorskyibacter sp. 2E107]|uniref:COG3650 family protein n=1 Tax=Primorskyibacter sp. 2E107 TaxID=3403458 RepID=UPI003AF581EC